MLETQVTSFGFIVRSVVVVKQNLASLKAASKQLSDSIMKFYPGDKPGQTPGLVPATGDFQWWESGAMFGQVSRRVDGETNQHANVICHLQMVEYWYYTADDRYNNATRQALLFQAGPDNNDEPANQTRTEVCPGSFCLLVDHG